MKRKIKLIGLDLDGTLLNAQKEITEHTKEVLKKAVEQGIVVVPSTGRGFGAVPQIVKNLEGVRYILTSNGATIVEKETGNQIYTNYMDSDVAIEAIQYGFQMDTLADVYIDGKAYAQTDRMDNLEKYVADPFLRKMIHDSRTAVDDLVAYIRENNDKIEKINMIFAKEEEQKIAREYWQKEERVEATWAISNNLELNHKTASKGNALLHLGEILGIKQEEIMVCGDGVNDMEMIRMAGMGVAMGNAMKEVKEVANFVTKTNEEDGVAFAIEQIALN